MRGSRKLHDGNRVTRRGNGALRCSGCRLHGSLCVCELVPKLETRTRLVLYIHRFEERKPTNTGLLAASCLAGSDVRFRGRPEDDGEPFSCPEGSRALVLFPYEDATPLDQVVLDDRPVTLVVPDGNWRQASKVYKRVAGLRGLPCVSLPAGPRSSYRLRAEAHDSGLSTLEAIARAFGHPRKRRRAARNGSRVPRHGRANPLARGRRPALRRHERHPPRRTPPRPACFRAGRGKNKDARGARRRARRGGLPTHTRRDDRSS